MTTNHDEFRGADEFWGAQAEWPEVLEADRRQPRASAATTVSRWWNTIVGGSSTAHRTHGHPSAHPASVRPEASASHLTDHPRPQAGQPARAHREVPVEAHTSHPNDGNVEIWDGDWELDAPEAPRGGVDPLLARAGGAAIVLTLLVPLVLGLGGGGDGNSETAATLSPPSTTVVTTTTATAVVPTVDGAEGVEPAPGPAAEPAAADQSAAAAAPATSAAPAVASAQAELVVADTSGDGLDDGALASDPAERIDPPCAIEYTIVAGDFWIRIADGSGASLADLLEVNDASTSTPLYPGSTICLPAGSTTPPAPPAPSAPPAATTPPTTAAPVTTAAPAPVPPTVAPAGPTPTAAQVQQIIRDVWPDDLEARAIEIADRESNFVPTAKNYCCYGVFQIYWSVHQSWLAGLGITSADQLYDPATNARAAYALYQRAGGWGPWT